MATVTEEKSSIDDEGSMILLLSSLSDNHDEGAHTHQMSSFMDPAFTSLIFVQLSRINDNQLLLWETHLDETKPQRLKIISAEEQRHTVIPHPTWSSTNARGVTIESLKHPGDLTQLGITLTDHFSEREAKRPRVLVCIHSLTDILQNADLENVFQFLQILRGQIKNTGGVVHCHLDPESHEETTIFTLETLFDHTVKLGTEEVP